MNTESQLAPQENGTSKQITKRNDDQFSDKFKIGEAILGHKQFPSFHEAKNNFRQTNRTRNVVHETRDMSDANIY